jgi:hypothetical protein
LTGADEYTIREYCQDLLQVTNPCLALRSPLFGLSSLFSSSTPAACVAPMDRFHPWVTSMHMKD